MIILGKTLYNGSDEGDQPSDRFSLPEGVGDEMMAQRLAKAHHASRMTCLSNMRLCSLIVVILVIVNVVMAILESGWATSLGFLMTLMVGLVGVYFMRKAGFHYLAQLAAQLFFKHYPKKGLTHIQGYRLIRKLGMTSSEQKKGPLVFSGDHLYQDSGLSTSVLYLGIHEQTGDLEVVAYTQFAGSGRYMSAKQSLADFVASAFFNKKPQWIALGAEALHLGVIPRINNEIRNTFCNSAQAVLHPTVVPYLKKDSSFLRMAIRNNDAMLDELPGVNPEQLWVWADVNLPQSLRKPLFGKNRSLSGVVALLPHLTLYRQYRQVFPAVLVTELTGYCVEEGSADQINKLAGWLWNMSPSGLEEPRNPAINNSWMLKCAPLITGEITQGPRMKGGEKLKAAVLDAYRQVIKRMGLDPEAKDDEECHMGYKCLFGLEATLAAIPNSGRTLLNNDLGL